MRQWILLSLCFAVGLLLLTTAALAFWAQSERLDAEREAERAAFFEARWRQVCFVAERSEAVERWCKD